MQRTAALDLMQVVLSEGLHRSEALELSIDGETESGNYHVSAGPLVDQRIAVGIVGSKDEYRLALRVRRMTPDVFQGVQHISDVAEGNVDLLEVGDAVALAGKPWYQSEVRPLNIGCSLAHSQVESGTLGCFVRTRGEAWEESGSPVFLLSNNHVLAWENAAEPESPVLQPAWTDDEDGVDDVVGVLAEKIPLVFEHNLVDAAIALLDTDLVDYDPSSLIGLPPMRLTGMRPQDEPLEKDESVHKVGRTTGPTIGRIRATNVNNLGIRYGAGRRWFDQVFEVESDGAPFAEPGDSGSLAVDDSGRAIGLLFAVSDDRRVAYANPIHEVLGALEIDLLLQKP